MNISTNALLNTLMTKVDSTVKAKIERLCVDGKVDLSTVIKDKSIQTLLSGLLKEIASKSKNKTEVMSLLENNKQSLKFQNISTEIKQIITLLKTQTNNIPKIKELTNILKNSLIDIKNIDEKVMKSTIANSGVFLESKLAKADISVSNNLKNLLNQVDNIKKILQNIDKLPTNTLTSKSGVVPTKIENIPSDIKNSVKQTINSILQKIESLQNKKNTVDTQLSTVKKIDIEIKGLEEKLTKLEIKNNIGTNLKELFNHVKSTLPKNTLAPQIQNSLEIKKLTSELKNILIDSTNINEKTMKITVLNKDIVTKLENIPNNFKNTIKQIVNSILQKVESLQNKKNTVDTQLSTIKQVDVEIKGLEEKLTKLEIKSDIGTNLKELFSSVKNNLLKNSAENLTKTIVVLKEQLENIKSNNIDEIKTDVKKLETQIKLFNNEKNVNAKEGTIKEVSKQINQTINKIDTSNIKELLKNNIGLMKNISGDLKNVMLQVQEAIELQSSTETVSKELKNNIDRVLSQIDYYQLSSYSSNSSHSYISFLQDDIEDIDIKFNNDNDDDFSCLIHLTLKEKGDLKILLQLDKKNGLNINIGVEQEKFKSIIQSKLQDLRLRINSIGLSILSLNIFDLQDEMKKSNELKAYGDNQNLDFGVDIKV